MNRTLRFGFGLLIGTATLAATGCSSPQPSDRAAVSFDAAPVVALGDLGVSAESPARGGFFLGAGDALGQEIFVQYVASLRAAESTYATGEGDFQQDQ
jgi:hypothetical protein